MRLFVFLSAYLATSFATFAQATTETEEESSPVAYILIGMVVIGLMIYMLQKRQKRKFNE